MLDIIKLPYGYLSRFFNNTQMQKVVPLVFLAPFLIVFLVFKVYPVILAIIMSFQNFQGVRSQERGSAYPITKMSSSWSAFSQALTNTTGSLCIHHWHLVGADTAATDSGRLAGFWARDGQHGIPTRADLSTSFDIVGGGGNSFQTTADLLAKDGFLNLFLENSKSGRALDRLRWLEVSELALPSLILIATWRWTVRHKYPLFQFRFGEYPAGTL